MKRITLKDVFSHNEHDYEAIHRVVKNKVKQAFRKGIRLVVGGRGNAMTIDLEGRTFILNRPLELHNLNLVRLTNGTLIAGPDFPKNEFLISIDGTYGLELHHLFLECSKRASGIKLTNFLRVRIEDCYVIHQTEYGIYSSPIGGNHELEIFKCHISEFLYGDGYPKKELNYGIIPEFDIDANRQSTGIFLGQADNIVADCNINLCRVGIFSGMRANRIHGNHITGGGSKKLEIFKGIELNNFHKSSAMIVNNYIDNCCLWINCNANDWSNLRNYIHVTDNLFYRGYNHPLEGDEEFHHIVINPLESDSLISNLHIRDNLFYNQPENLEGIKPRVITPIHVRKADAMKPKGSSWEELIRQPGMPLEQVPGVSTSMNHARLHGISIGDNHFTNNYPTFVVPMGSTVIKEIEVHPQKQLYTLSFDKQIPLGVIRQVRIDVLSFEGGAPPVVAVRQIQGRKVTIYAKTMHKANIHVEVSSIGKYSKKYDYIVK